MQGVIRHREPGAHLAKAGQRDDGEDLLDGPGVYGAPEYCTPQTQQVRRPLDSAQHEGRREGGGRGQTVVACFEQQQCSCANLFIALPSGGHILITRLSKVLWTTCSVHMKMLVYKLNCWQRFTVFPLQKAGSAAVWHSAT